MSNKRSFDEADLGSFDHGNSEVRAFGNITNDLEQFVNDDSSSGPETQAQQEVVQQAQAAEISPATIPSEEDPTTTVKSAEEDTDTPATASPQNAEGTGDVKPKKPRKKRKDKQLQKGEKDKKEKRKKRNMNEEEPGKDSYHLFAYVEVLTFISSPQLKHDAQTFLSRYNYESLQPHLSGKQNENFHATAPGIADPGVMDANRQHQRALRMNMGPHRDSHIPGYGDPQYHHPSARPSVAAQDVMPQDATMAALQYSRAQATNLARAASQNNSDNNSGGPSLAAVGYRSQHHAAQFQGFHYPMSQISYPQSAPPQQGQIYQSDTASQPYQAIPLKTQMDGMVPFYGYTHQAGSLLPQHRTRKTPPIQYHPVISYDLLQENQPLSSGQDTCYDLQELQTQVPLLPDPSTDFSSINGSPNMQQLSQGES
ncbi:hypothetical protein BBP40_012547 [Aspergillus hancockii]|nr:hypothetical protein BBP40_012547 [Aspergillus hancockii]